jgi:hypothetical protein
MILLRAVGARTGSVRRQLWFCLWFWKCRPGGVVLKKKIFQKLGILTTLALLSTFNFQTSRLKIARTGRRWCVASWPIVFGSTVRISLSITLALCIIHFKLIGSILQLQNEVHQCHHPRHSSPCSRKCSRSIKWLEPTPLHKYWIRSRWSQRKRRKDSGVSRMREELYPVHVHVHIGTD